MNKINKIIIPIISISFIYIGNTLYGWSLVGKNDIDWLHHNLSIFGLEIFTASILYFIGFLGLLKHIVSIYNSNSNNNNNNNNNRNNSNNNRNNSNKCYNLNYSPPSKINLIISKNRSVSISATSTNIYLVIVVIILLFGLISTIYQVSRDLGATLVNHGQYNLLALSALLLLYISNYIFWSLLLKYFKFKQIILCLFSSTIVFLIFMQIKNIKASRDWSIGLDGKSLMFKNSTNSSVCQIDRDFIVWPEFQPSTWLVSGSRDCPKQHGFSSLDSNNILTVHCSDGLEVSYTTSPTFFEEQKQHGIFTDDLKAFEKRYQKKKFNYTQPVLISDETVMAQCGNKTEIHFQNIKNINLYKRANNFNSPKVKISSGRSSDSGIIKTMKPSERSKPIDILVLMFDALSRAHFKRALPLTFNRLQEIQNQGNSKVFQFFRYHSLKPYTNPNTIAMYTGYSKVKYSSYDRATISEKLRKNNGTAFSWERFPMFFQSFRNDSYITSWVYGLCEDWFQAYLKTDRPENSIDIEMVLPFCSPVLFPLDRPFGLFKGPYSIRSRCLGNKHAHELLFDYINQVWDNYSGVGKILTSTFMDGHESTMEVVKTADKQLEKFIGKGMESRLNDTVLILVSDHGNHQSPYYTFSKGGKIEVALPMLYIVLPASFTSKYPDIEKNLLDNENKLASPFQLYDTIRALSKFPEFGGIDMYDVNNIRSKLGLLGKIPDDIKCSDLGIPHNLCVCNS